jgi:hypothetical protein
MFTAGSVIWDGAEVSPAYQKLLGGEKIFCKFRDAQHIESQRWLGGGFASASGFCVAPTHA